MTTEVGARVEALRQQLAIVVAERRRNYKTLARRIQAAIAALEAQALRNETNTWQRDAEGIWANPEHPGYTIYKAQAQRHVGATWKVKHNGTVVSRGNRTLAAAKGYVEAVTTTTTTTGATP